MADPECARGGGVNHILAEKRGVIASFYSKICMKCNNFTKKGGGRTPGTPYAGSATVSCKASSCLRKSAYNRHVLGHNLCQIFLRGHLYYTYGLYI